MAYTLHTIKPAAGSHKKRRRVGRGNASGRGTYSGRGVKGQRARSGGKSGLKMRGLKQFLFRIPKQKGFTSKTARPATITTGMLDKNYASGETVSMKTLHEKRLVPSEVMTAKIVLKGEITKKLTVLHLPLSKAALASITKAGGALR
ncbi:MAG: 50S ribosomal protein L15 [bacterium]|nr:50S ribosomal protein L15 [bacterium]